jgi:PAS domain-containing protein
VDLLETYLPEDREIGRQPGAAARLLDALRAQLLRRDGTTIPIDVSVAWLGNGERQLIMRDVTARQRAEEAQLAEERRLRSLLRISEVECDSVPELLNVTLAEVVALSDSAFGYIYAYDEIRGVFTLHSWSREADERRGESDRRPEMDIRAGQVRHLGGGREPAPADRRQRSGRRRSGDR